MTVYVVTFELGYAAVVEDAHGAYVETAWSPKARRAVEKALKRPAIWQGEPSIDDDVISEGPLFTLQPGEPGHVRRALESLPHAVVTS